MCTNTPVNSIQWNIFIWFPNFSQDSIYHSHFLTLFFLITFPGVGHTKPFVDESGNMIRFIDSGKGKRQLSINNHIFTKMSHHGAVTYWRSLFSWTNWIHTNKLTSNKMKEKLFFADVISIPHLVVKHDANFHLKV